MRYTEPIAASSWRFGRNPQVYLVPQKSGRVAFDAGVEGGTSELTIFTDEGILLKERLGELVDYTETIEGRTWKLRRFSLAVTAGKTYSVRLRGGFNRFKLHSPLVAFNAHNLDDFDNYAYPIQYFYVPRGCTQLVYEDLTDPKTVPPGRFFLPGQPERIAGIPLGIKNLYGVAIKPGWHGQVLVCSFGHTSWSLKNLASPLSLQAFSYTE